MFYCKIMFSRVFIGSAFAPPLSYVSIEKGANGCNMFVLSSNNAISVFFLVVRERARRVEGGERAQCNMFILLVVNEASSPPQLQRLPNKCMRSDLIRF